MYITLIVNDIKYLDLNCQSGKKRRIQSKKGLSMDKKIIPITQQDGHVTKLHAYYADTAPWASLLVLHGMEEHIGRYEAFAAFCNQNGIDFYTYHHRGHGPENKPLGFVSKKDGHQLVTKDALRCAAYIRKRGRCGTFFLMGHSFGSLTARRVIQLQDDFDGVIICGTAYPDPISLCSGLMLTKIISFFKGPAYYSKLVQSLVFGSKDYKSVCKRTSFDWLSKDEANVDAYIADPLCGFGASVSFFHDLLSLAYLDRKDSNVKLTRRDLPIFLISGEEDPVGGMGKGVLALEKQLKRLNFLDLTVKLYPNDRHEILHEADQETVVQDILAIMRNHTK